MNIPGTSPLRTCALTVVLAAITLLPGCGGGGISDADQAACDAAASGDAERVYSLTSTIDNSDLKEQAERIKYGTASDDDDDAMTEMVTICTNDGYTPKTDDND